MHRFGPPSSPHLQSKRSRGYRDAMRPIQWFVDAVIVLLFALGALWGISRLFLYAVGL